jgi:hypothetical protein
MSATNPASDTIPAYTPVTKTAEETMNATIMAIVVAVVFAVLINWITDSVFIQTYTWQSFILIGGLLFALSKASLTIRRQTNYRWTMGIMALIFIGGWLITDARVKTARYGGIALGFVFLIDLVYMIYAKYAMKDAASKPIPMDTISFWMNVAGNGILSILFFYSLTQTN